MALPDLTRLAIGTHPPRGAPRARPGVTSHFTNLPDEIKQLILNYATFDDKIKNVVRSLWICTHPSVMLSHYDAYCATTTHDEQVTRAKQAVEWKLPLSNDDSCSVGPIKNDDAQCRRFLHEIFDAYGWTKWLREVDVPDAPDNTKKRLRIDNTKKLDTEFEPLPELRKLAGLHAACYVSDDEAEDVVSLTSETPVRIVFVDDVRDRDLFVADFEFLSFEYVTSKLGWAFRHSVAGAYNSDWNYDVSRWNPRSLRDASGLFDLRHVPFGGRFEGKGVEKWTMTELKDANSMFMWCKKFNANLELWNPLSLRDARHMFAGCDEFEGNGLSSWSKQWAENLSNASGMFMFCHNFKISNLNNWRLPNYQLDATGMFDGVPISLAQAIELANSMNINTRGTEHKMANISASMFESLLPRIYSSRYASNPVASADELNAKNPWHVAFLIFGRRALGENRSTEVMAQLVKAVEKWQKKFPAQPQPPP